MICKICDYTGNRHPKCAACTILMGEGHIERNIMGLCSTCVRRPDAKTSIPGEKPKCGYALCKNCGSITWRKNSRRRFCGDKCRITYHRARKAVQRVYEIKTRKTVAVSSASKYDN